MQDIKRPDNMRYSLEILRGVFCRTSKQLMKRMVPGSNVCSTEMDGLVLLGAFGSYIKLCGFSGLYLYGSQGIIKYKIGWQNSRYIFLHSKI